MGSLIVISGPSGVGKGTIINKLKTMYQEKEKNLYVSVSYTTRSPRPFEIEGKDYHFISLQEFKNLIKNNGLLEYNEYGTGKYYGTPKDIIFNYLDNGYDVILEIDVNGYQKIKKLGLPHKSIFIAPPNMEELEKRLRGRNSESEDAIRKRITEASKEILKMNEYHHVIFNENGKLDEAVNELFDLINTKKYIK